MSKRSTEELLVEIKELRTRLARLEDIEDHAYKIELMLEDCENARKSDGMDKFGISDTTVATGSFTY